LESSSVSVGAAGGPPPSLLVELTGARADTVEEARVALLAALDARRLV
jgi:hypothetical protein